jgi:5-formyltetrahydrofolate cyclo-ligase
MLTETEQTKKTMREEAMARRQAYHQRMRDSASKTVRDKFLGSIPLEPHYTIAGYWPLSGELDSVPLLTALHERNYKCCLPIVTGYNQPLIFREWTPGQKLVDGFAGTKIPSMDAAEVLPDILLVPLIAFDRAGYRLGYGGGFYDRTLADLRQKHNIRAVGIAYSVQQMPIIPHEGHDMKLDWIVTENGALDCR